MADGKGYWESLYRRGGTSGEGSVGEIRRWKWKIINKYTNAQDVVDVCCGDLSFWEGKDCLQYTGIDISPFIIEKNKKLRPNWKFICASADITQSVKSETVFCFDALFHILDEFIYINTIKNLTKYSKNFILVYTWINNPFSDREIRRTSQLMMFKRKQYINFLRTIFRNMTTDFKYQIYRNFFNYIPIIESEKFKLIEIALPKKIEPFGAMFVFKMI